MIVRYLSGSFLGRAALSTRQGRPRPRRAREHVVVEQVHETGVVEVAVMAGELGRGDEKLRFLQQRRAGAGDRCQGCSLTAVLGVEPRST